jgi:hypothetical protein
MIIQIISHNGALLGLDEKGLLWARMEDDYGWAWTLLPTEFEETK